jgi:hypothetical protein
MQVRKIVIVAAAILLFTAAGTLARPARHSCPPPQRNFYKSLQATRNVSCRTVHKVLAVWDHQEFPPFVAAGFN